MLAKIVGLVADIRRIAVEIDRLDPLPTGELDMTVMKPWIEVQGVLTRRLLALTRCLGLTQVGHITGKGSQAVDGADLLASLPGAAA